MRNENLTIPHNQNVVWGQIVDSRTTTRHHRTCVDPQIFSNDQEGETQTKQQNESKGTLPTGGWKTLSKEP